MGIAALFAGRDSSCAGFLWGTGGDCVFYDTDQKSNVVCLAGYEADRKCGEHSDGDDRATGIFSAGTCGKGYTLTLPVVATYPGLLKISVSRVYIKDLMGFFRLKKNVEQTAELSILPRAVTDIAYEKTALEQGMLESEESLKRGNDFSDVQEVREYIPGDKLMSIHWKLSAKRDILMVKDRVSMSDHQLVIVPELFIDQPVNLAAILTMTYSVILELIQEQTTVRLLYWSTNRYEYEDVRIDYKEELDAAFARLYYEKAYKNPSEAADHMALVYPEMHAYLHVFSDGQGAQMQVRENE